MWQGERESNEGYRRDESMKSDGYDEWSNGPVEQESQGLTRA